MKNWFFEKINKMNKIIARLKSSCHNLFQKNTKNYCRLLWKPYAKKLKIQEEMDKFWTQNLSNMNHETETLNRPTMNMEIDLVTESLPSQKNPGDLATSLLSSPRFYRRTNTNSLQKFERGKSFYRATLF